MKEEGCTIFAGRSMVLRYFSLEFAKRLFMLFCFLGALFEDSKVRWFGWSLVDSASVLFVMLPKWLPKKEDASGTKRNRKNHEKPPKIESNEKPRLWVFFAEKTAVAVAAAAGQA